MRSVRAYLIALVVTCMLLASIGFGFLLWQSHENSRREVAAQGRETAQVLSLAVDAELERASGVLSALAASNAVRDRDWKTVDRVARAAFPNDNAWVVVQGRDGQQWVNTALPAGTRLPKPVAPKAMWDALDKGQQHICDLSTGAIEHRMVCVDVGEGNTRPPAYALSVVFRPVFFRTVVRRANVGAGELASLVDRQGVVIWRNLAPERFLGKSATGPLLAAMKAAPSGSLESTSLEGVPVLTSFHRSPKSGWTVIVGVPLRSVNSSLFGTLMHGSLVALILVVLGCLLAAILGGRLTAGLERLGHSLDPNADPNRYEPTGLAEFDAAAHALQTAFQARLRSERNQQMLIGELNHRVKNTLAVVQSLARQTFGGSSDPKTSVAAFEARLQALGQAHNLLTRERWHSAPLKEIVEIAMAPFCTADRCRVEGADVTVPPKTAVSLALALHELGTNAVKYGALSTPDGTISIRWERHDDRFELRWHEAGGPAVSKPTRTGFGTRLIERSLAAELDGEVTMDFAPGGLKCIVVGRLAPPNADVLDSLEA